MVTHADEEQLGWGLLVQHAERHSQAKLPTGRGEEPAGTGTGMIFLRAAAQAEHRSPPLTVSMGGAAILPSACFWGDKCAQHTEETQFLSSPYSGCSMHPLCVWTSQETKLQHRNAPNSAPLPVGRPLLPSTPQGPHGDTLCKYLR